MESGVITYSSGKQKQNNTQTLDTGRAPSPEWWLKESERCLEWMGV